MKTKDLKDLAENFIAKEEIGKGREILMESVDLLYDFIKYVRKENKRIKKCGTDGGNLPAIVGTLNKVDL